MKMYNPPHPGAILSRNYLEPLQLSVTDVAKAIGVSRKNLSQIIHGHVGISPEMAVRLSRAFDTTPGFWLSMQAEYDIWHAEQRLSEEVITKLYSAETLEENTV